VLAASSRGGTDAACWPRGSGRRRAQTRGKASARAGDRLTGLGGGGVADGRQHAAGDGCNGQGLPTDGRDGGGGLEAGAELCHGAQGPPVESAGVGAHPHVQRADPARQLGRDGGDGVAGVAGGGRGLSRRRRACGAGRVRARAIDGAACSAGSRGRPGSRGARSYSWRLTRDLPLAREAGGDGMSRSASRRHHDCCGSRGACLRRGVVGR
jgi:hypothetical protein